MSSLSIPNIYKITPNEFVLDISINYCDNCCNLLYKIYVNNTIYYEENIQSSTPIFTEYRLYEHAFTLNNDIFNKIIDSKYSYNILIIGNHISGSVIDIGGILLLEWVICLVK